MAELDNLYIKIQAEAVKANDAIDRLDDKLERLERALTNLNKVNINGFANGVERLSKAMVSMNQVKTADFTRLAKNLANLSTVNVAGLNSSASAVIMLSKAFTQLSNATTNANNIAIFVNALSKLGSKGMQNAIINIPRISYSMRLLFENLSTLPTVNRNIIDMTNALANLASQGSKVGNASKTIVSGLNRTNTAMARTTKQATSLASAFGKFYASYFLIIRGVKGLWDAVESSMDYVETYNYFNVALGKIGEEFAYQFKQYGYDSAESYVDSFGERLNELNKKMTGYMVGDSGELILAGDMGLGLNIEQLMKFQAKVLSVTNSVGLMGEASTSTAKAVSMLAGDLSSLTNVDIESVMESLTSGLIGQSRALYKYGIDITNNTLQQYAYAEGIEKAVSEMTQSEKMQLRLLAILDQSKVAWGDLGNTVDSVANQYRVFQQQIGNLGRTFGSLFLPIVQNVLPYINGLVIALNNLFTSLGFSMYGDTWLSDLQDGISGSVQGDVGELEEGLEDASDAAKKLKKNLSSFDELEVISISGVASAKDAKGVIDLTSSIADALGEYEAKWNEAFEKAENNAVKFAEVFNQMFEKANIVAGFEDITSSVREFIDVSAPLTGSIGTSFVEFFGNLSEITLSAFTSSLNGLSDLIGEIDPDILETFGRAIGTFTAGILGFSAVYSLTGRFADGIKNMVTAITAHPVATAAALLTGFIAALVDYRNTMETLDFSKIDETSDKTRESLSDITSVFSDFSGTLSDLTFKKDSVTKAVEDYYSLLNDPSIDFNEKKNQLENYVNYITTQFPQLSEYVNSHTGLFDANKDAIVDNINALTDYAKSMALQDVLKDAYKEYYEAQIAYRDQELAFFELVREYNENYTRINEHTGKVQQMTWKWDYNVATEDFQEARAEFEAYGQELEKQKEYIRQLESGNISFFETSGLLETGIKNNTEETKKYNTEISNTDAILSQMSNGTIPNLTEKFGLVSGSAEEVTDSIKGIGKEIENLNSMSINIPMNIGGLSSKYAVSAYSVGGFPEDGLFMANHGELVGRFSNGKTAVANNQQIVEGIKQGVYEAVVSAIGATSSDNSDIVINMDGREVFRVVQNRANEYYNVNGRPAFNI